MASLAFQTSAIQAFPAFERRGWDAMPEGDNDQKERIRWGKALRSIRLAEGMTLEQAGEKFGMTAQGYRRFETGEARSIFQPETQRKLAAALGRAVEEVRMRVAAQDVLPGGAQVLSLAERRNLQQTSADPSLLQIRGRVQAGAWLPSDDLSQVLPKTYPAARDLRFPNADQYLREVQGDSMNLAGIQDGDLIHCVSTADIGYWPQDGHLVEVERLRFDGAERELTVKEVQLTRDGILLWPRSNNPKWSEPLPLTEGLREGEDIVVRIVGRVLASIRRFD